MLSEDRIPGMQDNINILKIEKPRTNKTFISAIHYRMLENIRQVLILGRIILTVCTVWSIAMLYYSEFVKFLNNNLCVSSSWKKLYRIIKTTLSLLREEKLADSEQCSSC